MVRQLLDAHQAQGEMTDVSKQDASKNSALEKEFTLYQKIFNVRKTLSEEEFKDASEKIQEIGLKYAEIEALEKKVSEDKKKIDTIQTRQQENFKQYGIESKSDFEASDKIASAQEAIQDRIKQKESEREATLVAINQLKTQENVNTSQQEANLKEINIELDALKADQKDLNELYKIATDETDATVEAKKRELEASEGIVEKTGQVGKDRAKVATYVKTITAITQAVTLLAGSFKTLADEAASTEDKVSAGFDTIFGSLAAAANIALPGSGMLVQGIGGIAKAFGLDGWVEMLETGEEKLEKAIAKEKEFNQALEKTVNIVDLTKESIKNIEEFADRFDYLQSLAEKGLLTDELQSEYEGYLKEVQKYNDDAMISYNEQGKLITNNRNLMAETVELQKELIKERLKEQFSDEK
jgi:hypothetical protein